MFTGLVESIGEVVALQRSATGARLVVRAPSIAAEIALGESIAVNGCCLTAVAHDEQTISFDLLQETLQRTNLGALSTGAAVNLERALPAQGRLGGHFVQGHIDGVATVLNFAQIGADHRLEITLPAEFAKYVAFKGSIAIDGISLTVAEVTESSFAVWVIPHTLSVTNLCLRVAGEEVNLEFDLLAKYVERLLASPRESSRRGGVEEVAAPRSHRSLLTHASDP